MMPIVGIELLIYLYTDNFFYITKYYKLIINSKVHIKDTKET